MGKTAKDSCPNCRQRFRLGDLPTHEEMRQMRQAGVVNLGDESVTQVTCPKCSAKLRVSVVRMGKFFTTE